MKIIDIHSHILPGLDDGASSERESIRMLKLAAKQGVTAVIATPHYSPEYLSKSPDEIRNMCASLEQKAREAIRPEFRIYSGQEVLYNQDVPEKLQRGEILTLADSRYVLVEFMPWVPYSEMQRCVRTLTQEQYRPIFAHVERYEVLREEGRPEELVDMGALLQMNYRRISGKWYEETTRWCRKMLKQEKIHFLGTDMHNTKTRRPSIDDAYVWMDKHLEPSYLKKICYRNQKIILNKTNEKEKKNQYGKHT